MKTLLGALVISASALSTAALADEIKPAIVFDMGGRHDKSFNEGIDNGAKKFTKETGIKYGAQEVTNEAQREQFLRTFAQKGYDPVIAVGFAQADALSKVAKEFPKTHFTIIDMVVDLPNVQSIVFKEQEGSFLVGMLAAMKSTTGTVGFVGGMDIPLIRKFECGYVQGVKYAAPNDKVLQNMTGTDPSAWNNPVKGGELAKSQIEQGADVVYAAAGGTGVGVYQAAVDAGKLAIGVDFGPELPASGQDAVVDGQARRRGDGKDLHGCEERHLEAGRARSRPGRRRRRRGVRQGQRAPDHARDEGQGRGGAQGHHLRQDQGARLHVGQRLPGVLIARTIVVLRIRSSLRGAKRRSNPEPL